MSPAGAASCLLEGRHFLMAATASGLVRQIRCMKGDRMLKKYEKRTNIGVGLGGLAQVLGHFVLLPRGGTDAIVGWIVLVAGFGLFVWGCCAYMRGKGYHPAWGALGMLSLIGLIVMIRFRDRHKGVLLDSSGDSG